MDAHQQLSDRIHLHLQDYLATPTEDRTARQYNALAEQLVHASVDYARQLTDERRTQLREQRKGVGR